MNTSSRLRTPTISYVAETERDAERLRCQLGAPVRVRQHCYTVTIDATTIGGIDVTASVTPQTPEVSGTPGMTRYLVL